MAAPSPTVQHDRTNACGVAPLSGHRSRTAPQIISNARSASSADDVRRRRHRRHRHLLRCLQDAVADCRSFGRRLVHHRRHSRRTGSHLLCRNGFGCTGFRFDVLVCVHHSRRVRRHGRRLRVSSRIPACHPPRWPWDWSQYLNKLFAKIFNGWQLPDQIIEAPWDEGRRRPRHGWLNLPAVVLGGAGAHCC